MARRLINPKQTAPMATETGPDGTFVIFNRERGYTFSDDKAMDSFVEFFLAKGFVYADEVEKKVPVKKKVAKKKAVKK